MRGPFFCGHSSYVDDGETRVSFSDPPCDVPAAHTATQANISNQCLTSDAATNEERQGFFARRHNFSGKTGIGKHLLQIGLQKVLVGWLACVAGVGVGAALALASALVAKLRRAND